MRKGIVIPFAVLLVVFLAIGCTDTGTDDTGAVPPEEDGTTNQSTDEQNQATDDQMTNQTTTEPTTTDNMVDNETVEGNESTVSITQDGFEPFDVQVTVGDTVTWTNDDTSTHTATDSEGVFDSGDLQPGESYSYTFDEAGTYIYGSTGEDFEAMITVVTSTGENSDTGENTSGDVVVVPES